MESSKYLTKSKYVMALSCPTKLYYSANNQYVNNNECDPFLEALAESGHQVGALAKAYFPDGHDIVTKEQDEALAQTNELLKQDNVTIFEAALQFSDYFVRIDILIKTGNHFDIYEVKAKSHDKLNHKSFFVSRGKNKGKLKPDRSPYLHDVAFQNYVLSKMLPDATINSYLMLVDNRSMCTTDGLHQKFHIARSDDEKDVNIVSAVTQEDVQDQLLVSVPVDDVVKYVHEYVDDVGRDYETYLQQLADSYINNDKISPIIGKHCKTCEFHCSEEDEQSGRLSGFKSCWTEAVNWSDEDFKEDTILSVWKYDKANERIDEGKIKFSELSEADFNIVDDAKSGLSPSQRQWLQVKKAKENDNTAYLDVAGMKSEMENWVYPLHFIDFETSKPALPFTSGRRPYEDLAFQFSHHIIHEDGRIEHAGQYLNAEKGVFPNIGFIRALKSQLEKDEGSIFCYATHENTVLNAIHRQLASMTDELEDAKELCEFIEHITHSSKKSEKKWQGKRDMIDMQKLVVRYYYHPEMKGSNSIKAVLPAILNDSNYLQNKYSKPIYGARDGIKSTNFSGWTWVIKDGDEVKDPYKLLPPLFSDISDEDLVQLEEEHLNNGGAAMTAYARMQFEDMSKSQQDAYCQGLLKYCELDTLAMVMIYEVWKKAVADQKNESPQ